MGITLRDPDAMVLLKAPLGKLIQQMSAEETPCEPHSLLRTHVACEAVARGRGKLRVAERWDASEICVRLYCQMV